MHLPSKPSRYRDLIKLSFKLYKISFLKVIFLSLILSTIIFIPRLLFISLNVDFFIRHPFSPNLFWLILINIASLILFIAMIWHMHGMTHGLREPLKVDLAVGLRKVLQVFIASILQSTVIFAVMLTFYGIQFLLMQYQLLFTAHPLAILLTTLVFFLQFILIIYILSLFLFVLPLIAVEDKGIISALEQSVSLVWNHWWRVFSVQMTPWLIYVVGIVILSKLFNTDIHIYFTTQGGTTIFAALLNIIIFALYIPWIAALLLVQLNDLEIRKLLHQK